MSILGLHLGVSFAELSLIDSHTYESKAYQRVYLPRLSLKNALQKFLQKNSEHSVEKIFMASNHVEKLAPFRLGGSTAHLITAGWENTGWLSQAAANSTTHFLTRPPAVQSQELIFPVKERISSSGQTVAALDAEYISQVAAKLKLMEVKRVCVHFLNSQKNPAHLNQTCEILRGQGFEVFDMKFDTDMDLEKSRRLSLSAAVASTWDDIKLELSACEIPTFILTSQGFTALSEAHDPLENLAGLDNIWEHFKTQNIIYLGLESFFQVLPKKKKTIWDSPWGSVFRPHPHKQALLTQPGSPIQLNFWSELDFDKSSESFEPGPMSFGRGQKLMAFDLFFDQMSQQPELNDWLAPTAANKISSNLTALSKNSKDHKGPQEVATFLREQFKKRVLLESGEGEPVFMGFWTKIFAPLHNCSTRPLSESIARAGMEQPL
jgi:N-methylhydantoinase A